MKRTDSLRLPQAPGWLGSRRVAGRDFLYIAILWLCRPGEPPCKKAHLFMDWYYAINNERKGPVTSEQLAKLVAEGTVDGETKVWRQGMPDWQDYGSLTPEEGLPHAGATVDTEVCAVSGKRYPRREMIQYEGKWVSAEHRDTFFQRLREGVPLNDGSVVPGPYGYGNFGRRFVALLVDSILLGLVNGVVGAVVGGVLAATGGLGSQESLLIMQWGLNLFGGLVGLSVDILFIRKYDATPGKMALGLKVLRANGDKLSVGRIIGRFFGEYVSGIILGIGYIMAGFDDQRRTLHDRMCDTRVIKVRR